MDLYGNRIQDTKWRGNTSARHFCFTSFEDQEPKFHDAIMRYMIYQRECCPESKRLHWQGYVEMMAPMKFAGVKKLMGDKCHIEKRKGTRDEAKAYCSKEDSRVPGSKTIEWGTWIKGRGHRSDLDSALQCDSLLDVKEQFPKAFVMYGRGLKEYFTAVGDRKWKTQIHVIWGQTGTGKSRMANSEAPKAFQKQPNNKWWDGYNGHEDVILDDFRPSWFDISYMLNLLDRYPMKVEIKGGSVDFLARRLYITSCMHPSEWTNSQIELPQLLRRIEKITWLRWGEEKGKKVIWRTLTEKNMEFDDTIQVLDVPLDKK